MKFSDLNQTNIKSSTLLKSLFVGVQLFMLLYLYDTQLSESTFYPDSGDDSLSVYE